MPATPEVIIVDPAGQTLTVDILDSYGTSTTAYTASGGSSTHTLPLSISARTSFYLAAHGSFTVSAKYKGVEIAGDVVSCVQGVPVEVRPTINTSAEAEASFASTTGTETIAGNKTLSGTTKFGSVTADLAAVKGMYTSGTIAVVVPSITDPDIATVDVDLSALTFVPAVGDAVIPCPLVALPTNCRLQNAYVSATDTVTVVFGSEGGSVVGASKNFTFLIIDLT